MEMPFSDMDADLEIIESLRVGRKYSRKYDWVDTRSKHNRSPCQYPYSYSAHYKWRDFDKRRMKKDIFIVQSDRMRQSDPEKYREAFGGKGWITSMTKDACKEAIRLYFEGESECVGYAVECNTTSGHPVGLFFVKPVASQASKETS